MRNFDKQYLRIAKIWAENSYAIRTKVGAIIVKDNMIISDGFNGTPSAFDNCCETIECLSAWRHGCVKTARPVEESISFDRCVGCDHCKLTTKPEVLHAEANAITKLAKSAQSSEGATLYVTLSPCIDCAKLIIQSGIKRVVYGEIYRSTAGLELLEKAGIETEQIQLD